MSEFTVPVVRVAAIEPISGADAIELAVVGEYRSVVQKGKFQAGDLAVYLPEQAVLPEWLIEKLGLTGKLSGNAKNRIKAIKLRGCLSQGILYPVSYHRDRTFVQSVERPEEDRFVVTGDGHSVQGKDNEFHPVMEGTDLAEFLGVKKYDPEIPAHVARRLNGDCVYIPGFTVKYDLENWKKHPSVIADGEDVFLTEKLHGTLCCFAVYPGLNHPELPDDAFVYSKGLGGRGQVFKWNEANAENLYIKAFHAQTVTLYGGGVPDTLITVADRMKHEFNGQPAFLFGEVFGKGVQDLGYGQDTPTFRAFDIWIGSPGQGGFVDANDKYDVFARLGVEHVPVLYVGPFDKPTLQHLTDGKTTFDGVHVREGVVITPTTERRDNRIGRVALKNVSGDYLTRKGGTEFN